MHSEGTPARYIKAAFLPQTRAAIENLVKNPLSHHKQVAGKDLPVCFDISLLSNAGEGQFTFTAGNG